MFTFLAYLGAFGLLWCAGTQSAWGDGITTPRPGKPLQVQIMPVEERLPYLRKLKAFLEADPLDLVEFEKQFEVKLECRPWQTTGKICSYRTNEYRWPYAQFEDKSPVVEYFMFGDGREDSLWINLLYPGHKTAYDCITGAMVQKIFTPPEWTRQIGIAKSDSVHPHSSQSLILALDGRDALKRRIGLVTQGVQGCTGTLQIKIYPNKP